MIKCRALQCPEKIRDNCLRYTEVANWGFQKYYVDVKPNDKGECKLLILKMPILQI